MPKILTDKEMAEIITRAVTDKSIIDCADSYRIFIEDLGDLIASHFGGFTIGSLYDSEDNIGWTVGFHIDESVPADGGIFKDYDKDIKWEDGEDTE